jgi:uncharacterized cupredoxin-like copper-binding protein
VLLAALSTGHKVGLGLVGLAFILFALASAFLIPTFRPEFPGRRGLPAFLTLCAVLFLGMMFSVFFFGREPAEGHAAGGSSENQTTQSAPTTSETQTSSAPTTQSTSTQARTTQKTTTAAAPAAPKTVDVKETEFKISLPSQSLKPGKYELDLKNDGKIQHDLVVQGPGVSGAQTPVIDGGKTAKLSVQLGSGTYDFYCSVPGHKEAGMDVKVKVG